MPVFSYKGFDTRGKAVNGIKDADNVRALRVVLRRDGILITEAKEAALRAKAVQKGLEQAAELSLIALFNPIVMAIIGSAILGILMVTVVPKVTAIFDDTGKALPWNTQLLILISKVVSSYWYAVIIVVIAAVVLFRRWKRSPNGRAKW